MGFRSSYSRREVAYLLPAMLFPPTLRSSGREPQEARFPPLTF
jgi:hypothetical protein